MAFSSTDPSKAVEDAGVSTLHSMEILNVAKGVEVRTTSVWTKFVNWSATRVKSGPSGIQVPRPDRKARRPLELIGFRKVRVFTRWKFAGAERGYVAEFQMRWRWTAWGRL